MAFATPRLPLRWRARPSSKSACTRRYRATPRCNTSAAAIILDCDGVIVESEEIHRLAYNDCWEANSLGFEWSAEFYEQLQNTVGGGKEKMAWYFDRENNWPVEPALREEYLKQLHKQKTQLYVERVARGVPARRGVIRLIDEALQNNVKIAVASAANGDAVRAVLTGALGKERVDRFATILAGDDVKNKKPAPDIYVDTVARLNMDKKQCVVIEDSLVGMKAGIAAGLKVVVTYTDYTRDQDFTGADLVIPSMGEIGDDFVLTLDELFPNLVRVGEKRL